MPCLSPIPFSQATILKYLGSAHSSSLPGPDGYPLQTCVRGHMSVSGVCFSGFEDVKWHLSINAFDGPVFVHGDVCPVRCSAMNVCMGTCICM